MKKTDLLTGLLIGIAAALVGCFVFIEAFTQWHFLDGIKVLRAQQLLGKVITLGAVLNIAIFFVLLRYNREMMARGVILATILLTILTLVV